MCGHFYIHSTPGCEGYQDKGQETSVLDQQLSDVNGSSKHSYPFSVAGTRFQLGMKVARWEYRTEDCIFLHTTMAQKAWWLQISHKASQDPQTNILQNSGRDNRTLLSWTYHI